MRLDEFCSFMEEYLDEAPKFNLANPVRTTQSGWAVMKMSNNPKRPNRVDTRKNPISDKESRAAYDKVDTRSTGYTKPGTKNTDDNFLYHTTPVKNVANIEKQGVVPQGKENYNDYSKGKAFVSNHIGNYVMQMDIPGTPDRPGMAVLRIPRRATNMKELKPDTKAFPGSHAYSSNTIKGSSTSYKANAPAYHPLPKAKDY
jgi:hypothetical protein